MDTITQGQLLTVTNKDKRTSSVDTYQLTYLNEQPHLFTELEIKRALKRAEKNPEDILPLSKPGFFARLGALFG